MDNVEKIAAGLWESEKAYLLTGRRVRGFALARLLEQGLCQYTPTADRMISRLEPTALGCDVRTHLLANA